MRKKKKNYIDYLTFKINSYFSWYISDRESYWILLKFWFFQKVNDLEALTHLN